MTPESLEGYYADAKSKEEIKASKQTVIESLPKVLIFHLKRFSFHEGTQKISKFVEFPEHLVLNHRFLANSNLALHQRQYELFAVITHLGKTASDGHYICDVKRNNQWILFDDSFVSNQQIDKVLSRTAYILLYQQSVGT